MSIFSGAEKRTKRNHFFNHLVLLIKELFTNITNLFLSLRRGFEPLFKLLANHSCVPLVASGRAERARRLTRKSQKPTTLTLSKYVTTRHNSCKHSSALAAPYFQTVLVSRDTAWSSYRLRRDKHDRETFIIYTMLKHRGVWGPSHHGGMV